MKVQYRNTCSIRQAEVDFEKGKLIAIRGESNQGKSALFYVLLAGLVNSPEFKKFINNKALEENGKATATVTLVDDENNFWQVDAGTSHLHYRVNDAKYEKVGRKNIFEVSNRQIPGLLYDPEDSRLIMNIQGEDDGLFPIDRSDAQIFKTYERLLSLSSTEDILRTIKLDLEDVDYKSFDMTKSIQQSNEQLAKIEELFAVIDENKVNEILTVYRSFENDYNRRKSLYDKIESSATYVDKVVSTAEFPKVQFDIMSFQRMLQSLISAQAILKYCKLAEIDFAKTSFDINKAIELSKTYELAMSLDREVKTLLSSVESDEKTLKDINSILDSIKTCPLCGKPMGENHDC